MTMQIFNRYIFKNLVMATFFVTLTLSAVIVLTQSLRFLELIIESGAHAGIFWSLTILSLPRFWEIIIPIAAMVATLFIYNRLRDQSELAVLRATGFSPLDIARPALMLSGFLMIVLWVMTLWATPYSLNSLQKIRQVVKSQISASILREGVFNRLSRDITVYIQQRQPDGAMGGLLIYDKSNRQPQPTTILAKRGILTEKDGAYQVIVYEGSRQSYDPKTSVMQRLDFDRYTIDLPVSADVKERWREPNERTTYELFHPDMTLLRDRENQGEFMVEFHRRLSAPLLGFSFIMIAAATLIMGRVNRFANGWRSFIVIIGCVSLQGASIAASNLAKNEFAFVALMYALPLIPLIIIFYLMSRAGENHRRSLLYPKQNLSSQAQKGHNLS